MNKENDLIFNILKEYSYPIPMHTIQENLGRRGYFLNIKDVKEMLDKMTRNGLISRNINLQDKGDFHYLYNIKE